MLCAMSFSKKITTALKLNKYIIFKSECFSKLTIFLYQSTHTHNFLEFIWHILDEIRALTIPQQKAEHNNCIPLCVLFLVNKSCVWHCTIFSHLIHLTSPPSILITKDCTPQISGYALDPF